MEATASLGVSVGASRLITSAPFSFQHTTAVSVDFYYSSHILTLSHCSWRSLPFLLSHLLSLFILSCSQPDSGPGPVLLAGYEDGSLLLWDVNQRSKLSQAKVHPEPVMCLTLDTKCLRGISGSSEKKLTSWMIDRQNNLQVSRGQA